MKSYILPHEHQWLSMESPRSLHGVSMHLRGKSMHLHGDPWRLHGDAKMTLHGDARRVYGDPMEAHVDAWRLHGNRGDPWRPMETLGDSVEINFRDSRSLHGVFTDLHGCPRISMDLNGPQWMSMDPQGVSKESPRRSMNLHGSARTSMKNDERQPSSCMKGIHHIPDASSRRWCRCRSRPEGRRDPR